MLLSHPPPAAAPVSAGRVCRGFVVVVTTASGRDERQGAHKCQEEDEPNRRALGFAGFERKSAHDSRLLVE